MPSPKSSKSKDPMRPVDPQPMRSPSPPRTNSFPPPPAKSQSQPADTYSQTRFNPDYVTAPGSYNPQNYDSQTYTTQNYTTQNYDPSVYTTQSYNPQSYPAVSSGTGPSLGPGLTATSMPVRPLSNPQLPNGQGKMGTAVPGGMTDYYAAAPTAQTLVPTTLRELQSLKTNCQFGLREYLNLQRMRKSGSSTYSPYELDMRIRDQTSVLLSDLRVLQGEVRALGKEAESHRWRKWIIGGAIATFIPFIRRVFRRTHDIESQTSSNDTEYAFRKSKGLLDYIRDHVLEGSGYFAKFAFVVFAVLYVFSNEVTLRVARTAAKRIKKLYVRLEQGDPNIDENDMKTLEGWRWRVLLW